MDPISLSTVIIGLAAKFLSVANRCNELYEKDKQAFVTINTLNLKCRSVNTILDCVNLLLVDPRSASIIKGLDLPNWQKSLVATTDACRLTYECLEVELRKLGLWDDKKSITLKQRLRLRWNESNLKFLTVLLDSTTESVRGLLDVLNTAMLVPVVDHTTSTQLGRRATLLQKKLIEGDEKLGVQFRARRESTSIATEDPAALYTEDAKTVIYPRYRDYMVSIRSKYSKEESDFDVISLSSGGLNGSDAYSFLSTTPLVPDNSEKVAYSQHAEEMDLEIPDTERDNEFNEKTAIAEELNDANELGEMSPTQAENIHIDEVEGVETEEEDTEPSQFFISDICLELGVSVTTMDEGEMPDTPKTTPRLSRPSLADPPESRSQNPSTSDLRSSLASSTASDDGGNPSIDRMSFISINEDDGQPLELRHMNISVVGEIKENKKKIKRNVLHN